jgi:site-specific recombinase XerD
VNAKALAQARAARASELLKVEHTKVLRFAPPAEDSFLTVAGRFLAYQKARLTPKAYEREVGIVENHLKPFFSGQLASIRRVDVRRYVTERGGKASAYSVQKELNVLKHLFRLAVEWELALPLQRG